MSKSWERLSVLLLTVLLCTSFVLSGTVPATYSLNTVVSAASDDSGSTSLLDGIISLVAEKGSNIIRTNLPAIGDYLCAQVFDYIGIDYTNSYTKELDKVNKKLEDIEESIEQVLDNQANAGSYIVMRDFNSAVETFSNAFHPIYCGYNTLIRNEKDGVYSPLEAEAKETVFYKKNIEIKVVGSQISTGYLYEQLCTLLRKTIKPDSMSYASLMEVYNNTHEHLWAFNTMSLAPKKEFIGYVATTIMEGLMLYMFQNNYEIREAMRIDDQANITVNNKKFDTVLELTQKAFQILQAELEAVEKEEREALQTGTIFHYASGKSLSNKLYVDNIRRDKNNYTYKSYYNITRQNNVRNLSVITLNNRDFVSQIENDFVNYKKNYKTGNNFTVSQFLQVAGFNCDNWNNNGLYKGQSFTHEGSTFTTEYYRFYLDYTTQTGLPTSTNWGYIRYAVLGSPNTNYPDADFNLMAFVDASGVLMGSYDTIYEDIGNTVIDVLAGMNRGSSVPNVKGKVW